LLASVCRATAATVLGRQEYGMESGDLVGRVVKACQAAIGAALNNPSEALAIAGGLQSTIATLNLVASETAKGEAGARHLIENARGLTQGALASVLKYSEGLLDANGIDVAPALASLPGNTAPPGPAPSARAASSSGRVPLFSEISTAYISVRREGGAPRTELQTLELRRKTWIDVIGDRPVDQYRPSDAQTYVNRMQFWPANVTKRTTVGTGDACDWNTNDVLRDNAGLSQKPMKKKTMSDGYLANVKTMLRFGMVEYDYRDPIGSVRIRWPKTYGESSPREGIDDDVLNNLFAAGVTSGCLDEAMLPLLAYLCSRRLGLLLYLRGVDIRRKHGVMVAQTGGIIEVNGVWQRAPIKTADSMTYFVLHEFLGEIGFIDWMQAQDDNWIFAAAHEHPDPSKYESKLQNRRLRAAGAVGGNIETIHSLRGDAISVLRKNQVQPRAARLQAGHELTSTHDKYGFRALSAEECQAIATQPLRPQIDWDAFKGLDYDALARGRRSGKLGKER
jgi:integrase